MRPLAFIICFLTYSVGHSQTEADWWFFGDHAGIHFTSTGVEGVSGSGMFTPEGCASIADAFGNLLFYSDGDSVWDRNHDPMPNGHGLLGNEIAAQSSIAVQKPGSSNIYYLFTIEDLGGLGTDGLRYHAIDMSLNGGLGDVVVAEKNVLLTQPTTEHLTCVKQPNGYWVISHNRTGDGWIAHEVTSSGVNLIPVTSNVGESYVGGELGYAKVSLDGTRLAAALSFTGAVDLFDFDVLTGVVSNPVHITSTNLNAPYGLEFSPDATRLYTTGGFAIGRLIQYDLTLGSAAAIGASEVVVHVSNEILQGLQLGPDMRIYYAKPDLGALAAITQPNELGLACGYQDTAVLLAPGTLCKQGLPGFVASFMTYEFSYDESCSGDSTHFAIDTTGLDSVLWNFGDPLTGVLDTSTQSNPAHLFSDTGTFLVTAVISRNGIIDTAYQYVYVDPLPSLNLGADTTICVSSPVLLDAEFPGATYLWRNGSAASTQLQGGDTTVWVTLFHVCDTLSDTIRVSTEDPLVFDLGPDVIVCDSLSYQIESNLSTPVSIQWSTNETTPVIQVVNSGIYQITATNACGVKVDQVSVTFSVSPPDTVLPADTVNCSGLSFNLVVPVLSEFNYLWSDSSAGSVYRVDTTETVWLAVFNSCGLAVDTMQIEFAGIFKDNIGADTAICDTDQLLLDASVSGATYNWNTGDTSSTILTGTESGTYVVTITRMGCVNKASIDVDMSDVFCKSIDCTVDEMNVFTPNADGINDRWVVTTSCNILTYDLSIFNRWGQLVYNGKKVNEGWDGFINGEPAPEGVYYYIMEFKDTVVVDVDRNEHRGSFTLLR